MKPTEQNNYREQKTCANCIFVLCVHVQDGGATTYHCRFGAKANPPDIENDEQFLAWLDHTEVSMAYVCDKHKRPGKKS